MPFIHFTSGKKLYITDNEFTKLPPQLKMRGIRIYVSNEGDIVPLNSNTMEFISREEEYTDSVPEKVDDSTTAASEEWKVDSGTSATEQPKVETVVTSYEYVEQEEKKEPKKTAEQIFLEKQSCMHEREKQKMFFVESRTAGKNKSVYKRFFPVCTFCGKRERYVSPTKVIAGKVEGWTEEDLLTAKEYSEK